MKTILSDDGKYRYTLYRDLNNIFGNGEILLFIGLNPSTADAETDDPTIRRVKNYAISFGYSHLLVGNLFAYRATNPCIMELQSDPVGPENDRHLQEMIYGADHVLCGWGTHGTLNNRDREVMEFAWRKARCLSVNSDGTPGHPLYLRKDLTLTPYKGR